MLADLQPSSPDFGVELTYRLRELRKTKRSEEIVSILRGLLSTIEEELPFLDVITELCTEHTRAGMLDRITDLHELALNRFPNSLNAHIAYAEHLIWADGNPALALEISTRAVSLAREENLLLRHALQGRARAAKKLGLYTLFEEILADILKTDQMGVHGDIRYEIDVVKGLPEGVVDPDLVAQFRARCDATEHNV